MDTIQDRFSKIRSCIEQATRLFQEKHAAYEADPRPETRREDPFQSRDVLRLFAKAQEELGLLVKEDHGYESAMHLLFVELGALHSDLLTLSKGWDHFVQQHLLSNGLGPAIESSLYLEIGRAEHHFSQVLACIRGLVGNRKIEL